MWKWQILQYIGIAYSQRIPAAKLECRSEGRRGPECFAWRAVGCRGEKRWLACWGESKPAAQGHNRRALPARSCDRLPERKRASNHRLRHFGLANRSGRTERLGGHDDRGQPPGFPRRPGQKPAGAPAAGRTPLPRRCRDRAPADRGGVLCPGIVPQPSRVLRLGQPPRSSTSTWARPHSHKEQQTPWPILQGLAPRSPLERCWLRSLFLDYFLKPQGGIRSP